MAVRTALAQFADSVGIGVLGLNRSCIGASTSGSHQQPAWVGLRLLRSLVESSTDVRSLQPHKEKTQHSDGLALASGCSVWAQTCSIFVRGYKSNKRSLKPFNTAASWQAVQPLLVEQQQQHELLQRKTDLPRPRWRPRFGPVVDTCLPPIPDIQLPSEYSRVGVITGQYELRPERTFGVVQLAGTQFKVTTDDIIFVNQLPGVEVNDVLALERVMLLGSRSQTIVGRPYVPGGVVLAAVEEHFRDGKIHVFKKKRRKRYRKYQAPRPNMTTLRILQVRGIDPAPGDELAMLPEVPIQLADARYGKLLGLPAGQGEEEEQQQQQAAATVAAAGAQ